LRASAQSLSGIVAAGKILTRNENPDSIAAMKTRTIWLTLALSFLGSAVCFAADLQMGTWKLNEAKSKIKPGTRKNTTVVYETAGDKVKVTTDGIDAKGKATRSVWTGKFDGRDYPVIGDSTSDARSYKKRDDRTSEFNTMNHGRVVGSGRIVVSADGKSRTVVVNGTDRDGKSFKNVVVYDKQ
jgi:hypothetical protein